MPPVSTSTPWPAAISSRASARAPSTVRCWRSTNSSLAAIFSATALAAITCSSGPPCWPGKTAESIFLAYSSLHRMIAGARAAERLVGRGRDDVGAVVDGVRVQARGDEAREVGHVDHQQGAHLVGDLAEAGEVQHARVGGPAGEQHLRPALAGDPRDLVHVDEAALAVHLIGGDVVEAPGDVELHAVREVPAVREREAHDRVARREQRVVDGRVRLRARSAAGRSRARRRTAPWRGRSRAARRCPPTRSRRSSGGPGSPRRTCSSGPSPGIRAPRGARSSPRRSSRACCCSRSSSPRSTSAISGSTSASGRLK